MDIAIWVLVFFGSLVVVIKASDYFIHAAENIGLSFRLSPFIIGAVILAFGTSIPELITSIYAVIAGTSEIVIGNVVGSNIANILLVLGCTAIVGKSIDVHPMKIRTELLFLFVSAVILTYVVWDGKVHMAEAILLMIGLATFLYFTIVRKRTLPLEIDTDNVPSSKELPVQVLLLVVSAAGIFFGAKFTIDALIVLSSLLNIATEVIALSAVALGTSLPELLVSVVAVRKGQGDMALGNILGSNVFNIFSVIAIPRFFGSLVIPESVIQFSLPVMLFATFLFFVSIRDKKLIRREGIVLVLLYLLYNVELFGQFIARWLN